MPERFRGELLTIRRYTNLFSFPLPFIRPHNSGSYVLVRSVKLVHNRPIEISLISKMVGILVLTPSEQ